MCTILFFGSLTTTALSIDLRRTLISLFWKANSDLISWPFCLFFTLPNRKQNFFKFFNSLCKKSKVLSKKKLKFEFRKLVNDSECRGQFHQHFMSSFYVRRSEKWHKDSQLKQLFALSGSAGVKTESKHFDEIDPSRCKIKDETLERINWGRQWLKRPNMTFFMIWIWNPGTAEL